MSNQHPLIELDDDQSRTEIVHQDDDLCGCTDLPPKWCIWMTVVFVFFNIGMNCLYLIVYGVDKALRK